MKRTTYILIGIFIANIALSVAMLIYVKSAMVNGSEHILKYTFAEEALSTDLEDIHTLKFSTKGIDPEHFYFRQTGKVITVGLSDNRNPVLSYPKSDYIKIDRHDGILKVVIDFSSDTVNINDPRHRGIMLEDLVIRIEAGKEVKKIVSDRAFDILISQLQSDSLHMVSEVVKMDSCMVNTLVLDGNLRFHGNASQFENLHIDLDHVDKWNLETCKVNTLYLTGSEKYKNRLPDEQFNSLVWEPKSEKAELSVVLKKNAEIVLKD